MTNTICTQHELEQRAGRANQALQSARQAIGRALLTETEVDNARRAYQEALQLADDLQLMVAAAPLLRSELQAAAQTQAALRLSGGRNQQELRDEALARLGEFTAGIHKMNGPQRVEAAAKAYLAARASRSQLTINHVCDVIQANHVDIDAVKGRASVLEVQARG